MNNQVTYYFFVSNELIDFFKIEMFFFQNLEKWKKRYEFFTLLFLHKIIHHTQELSASLILSET